MVLMFHATILMVAWNINTNVSLMQCVIIYIAVSICIVKELAERFYGNETLRPLSKIIAR